MSNKSKRLYILAIFWCAYAFAGWHAIPFLDAAYLWLPWIIAFWMPAASIAGWLAVGWFVSTVMYEDMKAGEP